MHQMITICKQDSDSVIGYLNPYALLAPTLLPLLDLFGQTCSLFRPRVLVLFAGSEPKRQRTGALQNLAEVAAVGMAQSLSVCVWFAPSDNAAHARTTYPLAACASAPTQPARDVF